jgi:hypothetical protein
MSQFKYRAYPLLIAAVTVLASTGAAFRGN